MLANSCNLPPSSNFRGLHPDLPVRIYHRHLPHWRQEGATYFVTTRLADSLPQEQLRALKRWRSVWEQQHPEPRSEAAWHQFAREIASRTEAWMDQGYGECVFQEKAIAQLAAESLLHFQGERCFVSCFVIMPNHMHVVVQPLEGFDLEAILKSVKQCVARRVNVALKRKGKLWVEESYDRIVRDEDHLFKVVQYIGRNPAKARLTKQE